MAVEFPEALFERVHSGTCVLCTGVRFAATAGMPDWRALFASMSEKLGADRAIVQQLIEQGKLLTVAGYLKRKLGVDTCAQLLKQAYGKQEPAASHRILGEIPFHAAVTTGYDTLVEQALMRNGSSPKVYTYADGPVLRLAEEIEHYVLKAHGDIGHLEQLDRKLVLSRLDFRRVIGPNQAFRAFVEDLYRTHTFLLVGFHPTDPDLSLFLDGLVSTFRDAVTDHYALMSGLSAPEAEELYANYRLRVIPYDEGDDPIATLTTVLTELRDQWLEKGAGLPGPEDPRQQTEWLRTHVAPLELRIDLIPAQGLELSEAKLVALRNAAAAMDPKELDPETLCRLGNVCMMLEDLPSALRYYRAAVEAAPDSADAHINLHVGLSEARQVDEALEHLKKAMELEHSLRIFPRGYELKTLVGRGSTGSIYFARDTEKKRDVTVKVLRTSYLQEYASPEQWLKETEPLKRLEHRNLAGVHEVLLEHGKCVLVTECLSGRSVSKLLDEGRPTPERVAEILGQVCEGLQYAHERDVCHLDLTPSNVFLRDDGTVAVMDFRPGRARRGRRVAIAAGMEGYQAPELLAGAGADARADIYSLGALLYKMLTGQAPIGAFPRAGELNPVARRFDPLINRALRALPDERPQSVAEFRQALAGKTEAVALPDNEDDLMGWLEVLNVQPDHEKANQALARLESSYREQKDWDSLVTLILGRVEFETEASRREAMFRELAGIFEREVGDLGKAFAALKEAFRENTTSLEIRRDLERLAAATGMWNELLQEYTQLVQHLRDPKVACDWWVRIGRLYATELGHDDYAVASFNQALALDTNRVDAMNELSEVLQRKGDHKEHVRLLKRLIDLEEDGGRKTELLKEMARTYLRELGSDEEALAAYRQILAIDPGHTVAVSALDGLYRKLEMWEELVQLLKDQVGITDDAEALRRYRRSLAQILAEQLNEPAQAIEHYQKLIEADPDDLDALKGLEKLYDTTGRNEEYLKILDRRIDAAGSDEEKATLCRRMAAEWEAQASGQGKAAEYLEKVVEYTGGDAESFKALVRLYWATKSYKKLAVAYGRHIDHARSDDERTGLYAGLGKVLEDHLQDTDQAIETYNNLLAIDPESKVALSALARLYERAGVWAQAVQMLERLATKEESVDTQVELFHRIGVIQLEHMRKEPDAEVTLTKALELKDDHVETMVSLAALYQGRKDFGKAARMLREAGRHTANELDRVKRLHGAGVIYLDQIGDKQKALEVFEELMEIDPEHVPTGERLAGLYEESEAWERVFAVRSMLVRKADPRDRARLIELNIALGSSALKAEEAERAVQAFRAAYDLDPTNQQALRRLASLLYARRDFDEAGKLFQALLVHRRDSLSTDEIVDVFYKLGDIKQEMGESNKALNMYEKALDLEPTNKRVLERAMALYEEKGDMEAVLRCRKNMLKGVTDSEERIVLAEEIGDLLMDRMRRYNDAVTHYRMAVEAKPDHRRVLNKIMEAYIAQKKWDEAIQAMGKIEDYETDPTHRARLHYTAAVILRDELARPKDAAWHLDQALVKDPSHRKAFDALKRLYNEQKNYKGLAKAYRLMLQRLPEDTPKGEQMRLWQELGEICHDKLQDAKGAIVAFEVAAKLDPTDEARQERLAQLYVTAGPDAYEKAILANQRRLKTNPLRQEAYKELRRLYAEIGAHDKAWCVAAVLSLLKKASAEETALYKKHRSEKPRRVARKLSADLWRDHLWHERQSALLNEAFASAAPIVAPMAVRSPKTLGGEPLDTVQETRPYAKVADYVAQVLDQQLGQMVLKANIEQGRNVLPILVGTPEDRNAVVLVHPRIVKTESVTELSYWMTKGLALLRPEHMLSFITPSVTVLRAVALAMLKVVRPSTRIGGDVDQIMRLSDVFKSDLAPNKLDMLTERAEELRGASTDQGVADWLEAVDLSVTRAALLVCDDLETAARLVATEATPGAADPGAAVKQRLQQLMTFAVSEDYFKLREVLGLQIK